MLKIISWALFWSQFQAAHVSLLSLVGREPWLLSGMTQEEEDGGGGTAAPALLDFTRDKNGQVDNM